MRECPCFRCTKERCEREPYIGSDPLATFGDPRMMRMFCCETCGNKRCPHAADHRHACTDSNEPGQVGSRYEDAPTFQPDAGPSGGEADGPSSATASAVCNHEYEPPLNETERQG